MILPMELAQVPIDRLIPHPANPRRGDHTALAQSLRAHGQYRPLVVQRSTHYVLAGNNTLAVARELGYTRLAVQYLDVDAETGKRILLADNRTNDGAHYDDDLLADLLESLSDVEGTGFEPEEVEALLSQTLDTLFTEAPDPPSFNAPSTTKATPVRAATPTPTPTPAPATAPAGPAPPPPQRPATPTPQDITLSYEPMTHRWMLVQLDTLTHELGYTNHADTLAHLIEHATGTARPKGGTP